MSDENKEIRAAESVDAPEKKQPYSKPRLVNFGQVRSLTQGSGTVNGDGGQGMMV